jgi:hypothetical protein
MYAHVSREEWLFRGLTLAMVGLAVMPPIIIGDLWSVAWAYFIDGERDLGKLAGAAINCALCGIAGYGLWYLFGRIGLIAAAAGPWSWTAFAFSIVFGA